MLSPYSSIFPQDSNEFLPLLSSLGDDSILSNYKEKDPIFKYEMGEEGRQCLLNNNVFEKGPYNNKKELIFSPENILKKDKELINQEDEDEKISNEENRKEKEKEIFQKEQLYKDEKKIKHFSGIFENNDIVNRNSSLNTNQNVISTKLNTNTLSCIENNNFDPNINKNNQKYLSKKRIKSRTSTQTEELKEESEEKLKLGRKKYNSIETGKHTLNGEDNIITKIKTNFMDYIRKLINDFLSHGCANFNRVTSGLCKMDKTIYNINLKRKENLELKSKTLGDIFSVQYSIQKGNKIQNNDHNIEIIKNQLSEKNDTDIKKILNLTFEEAFILFRNKKDDQCLIEKEILTKINLNIWKSFKGSKGYNFENYLKINESKFKKEVKSNKEEDLNNYINKMRYYCDNFFNWFEEKQKRRKNES